MEICIAEVAKLAEYTVAPFWGINMYVSCFLEICNNIITLKLQIKSFHELQFAVLDEYAKLSGVFSSNSVQNLLNVDN